MRDYTEISKWLRNCADINGGCTTCPMIGKTCCVMTLQGNAADAIEELLAKDTNVPNKWISVEERLPERTNPTHARDTYLVRLESGCVKTLFYEYDNSDRCRPGMSPLFSEGWGKTASPVTHWMPLPAPPKGVE